MSDASRSPRTWPPQCLPRQNQRRRQARRFCHTIRQAGAYLNVMSEAFARDFEAQSLRSLYRKMKKTAKARFNCAKRFQRHQAFSLWSVSLFSAGLIGMTLLSALHIQTRLSPPYFDLVQIMLALLVLVLSLLLSANNYSDRAEKLHRCALELNELCHAILPDCGSEEDKPEVYRPTLAKV